MSVFLNPADHSELDATDEAVASLARLRQLRYLQLSCPSLSSAAVLRLRENLPACRIVEPHRNK